ncbi:MAG: tetratricopeptide repeat protein [Candidatus Lokiarchaeota archaeon]|nr:tetratricopeptide repeat protein [Candidatus Lokiarchaeota archaeon]MBD3200925.1 tetratricopeptide repeat protein [Candidatus Lokiarchaeota archaeon]
MLSNNNYCSWSDFTQDIDDDRQLISDSTLSIYLNKLMNKNYIEKPERDFYIILPEGRKRFLELSKMKKQDKTLNIPPDVIRDERNYDHIILWMVYNNNSCKWSDFTEEPLKINQSSLSKNINLLMDGGFVRKENKKYKITQKGKVQYAQMLRNYNLDRQSILEEESKRIDEIIQKARTFFNKYQIEDKNVKYRFLNYNLKMNYNKLQSSLEEEDDFFKIILFFAKNHPDLYPEYISSSEFAEKFDIEKIILDFHILQIVDKQIFPIKFFKLNNHDGKIYYFPTEGKLERILRSIVDDYIYKFTYLRKLDDFFAYDMNDLVDDILDNVCGNLFNIDLKNALREFLVNNYIKHLTYEIETKKKLANISEKLEGYSYQTIQGIFQQNDIFNDHYNCKDNTFYYLYPEVLKTLASYYKSEVKEIFDKCLPLLEDRNTNIDDILAIIDEGIEKNPDNISLYILKSIYLSVYFRSDVALSVLNENILLKVDEEKLKSINPDYYPIISFIQCFADLSIGNIQDAISISKAVLKKYPDHPISHLSKALIYGYNTIHKWISQSSSLEVFISEIHKAISMDKNILNKSRYHQLKARVMFQLKEFERGFEAIDSALTLKENVLDYYFNKIHGLTMNERYEDALNLIDESIDTFPHEAKKFKHNKAYVFLKYAANMNDSTKIEQAIEILTKLSKEFPEDYSLLNSLAYAYSYNKNRDKSIEIINKLISLDPMEGNYYDSYGEILQSFEMFEEAIEKYKKGIELNPDGFYLYQTFPRLGECYYKLGEYDLAKQYLEKGLETISSCCCENEKKDIWDKKARKYLYKLKKLNHL